MLAAEAIRKASSEVVREGLGHAEDDDEREHRSLRDEVKILLGDHRENRSLHADHRADEGIHHDQQGELSQVLAQAQADAAHSARPLRPSTSTRQPRARQSMTPCSMRCARKPFLRSKSTASTAITQ